MGADPASACFFSRYIGIHTPQEGTLRLAPLWAQPQGVMVDDNGELNMTCESCYKLTQGDRKNPKVNGKQWTRLVGFKRSRGKLAVGLGALGIEHKIMDNYVDKKIYAKNLLKEAADPSSPGKRVAGCVSTRRRVAFLQDSKNMHLPGKMMRTAVKAGLADDSSELTKSEELNPEMMAKLKERYCQARQEDDQRNRVVQRQLKGREGHIVARVPSLPPLRHEVFGLPKNACLWLVHNSYQHGTGELSSFLWGWVFFVLRKGSVTFSSCLFNFISMLAPFWCLCVCVSLHYDRLFLASTSVLLKINSARHHTAPHITNRTKDISSIHIAQTSQHAHTRELTNKIC